jgi:hypothetical protein
VLVGRQARRGEGEVHEGEHSAADREGKGNDQEHEECHLCYEQQEDLGFALALVVNAVNCVRLFRGRRGCRNART